MNKYRIKRTYKGYEVERKGLIFWKNCVYRSVGGDPRWEVAKIYNSYHEAKNELEELMSYDRVRDEREQARKAFKTRYYYPPLPDEEPIGD